MNSYKIIQQIFQNNFLKKNLDQGKRERKNQIFDVHMTSSSLSDLLPMKSRKRETFCPQRRAAEESPWVLLIVVNQDSQELFFLLKH